jgi:hypothetical protein
LEYSAFFTPEKTDYQLREKIALKKAFFQQIARQKSLWIGTYARHCG